MTVETGDFIADLDPTAPADSQPLGESNEHIQLVKRVLDTTFAGSAGDLYDDTAGPVFVGPIQTNRQPADIEALALEVGLDLDNTSADTRIDTLEDNRVRIDIPVIITESWAFTGEVEFLGAVDFSGPVPTISGIDIATVDDIPTDLERAQLKITSVSGNYSTIPSDIGKKIVYTGSGGNAISITGGANDDTIFVSNHGVGILEIDGGASETFFKGDGTSGPNFFITGRWRTVGLHKINGDWYVTGDYD